MLWAELLYAFRFAWSYVWGGSAALAAAPGAAPPSSLPRARDDEVAAAELSAADTYPSTFRYFSEDRRRPVVLRGLCAATPAVEKWTAEYLSGEGIGDTPVLSVRPPAGQPSAEYTTFAQKLERGFLTLRETIANMKSDNGPYVNNVTSLFAARPLLVDDLRLRTLRTKLAAPVDDERWLKLNLFIGGPGTKSSLHCAAGGNYFHNICGRKRWVLVAPRYSRFLRPAPSDQFAFVISGRADLPPNIPRYEVVLEPGDVLYVPPWWWHKVTNVDNFTIGVAVRDHATYWQSWKNNPLFMLLSPYSWKLHPWVLGGLVWLYGRAKVRAESMKSDTFIVDCLTK